VVEVAAEKNSTLVMPVPVELLRFFDRTAPDSGPVRHAANGTSEAAAPSAVSEAPEPPAIELPASLSASPAQDAPRNGIAKTSATA
jgi:hypothetical protein